MDSAIILYILCGIIIVLNAIVLYMLKNVSYLLEQPIVKKMSPSLNLKPVKVDSDDDSDSRKHSNRTGPSRRPTPTPTDGADAGRDRRPRAEGGRSEGGRSEGGRGDRGDRQGRGERGRRDRNRRPRPTRMETQSNEAAQGDQDAEIRDTLPSRGPERVHDRAGETPLESRRDPKPTAGFSTARRPLPARVAREVPESTGPVGQESSSSSDEPVFVGTDAGSIQHGRRNLPKKRPRHELSAEEEAAIESETKNI